MSAQTNPRDRIVTVGLLRVARAKRAALIASAGRMPERASIERPEGRMPEGSVRRDGMGDPELAR
jgi:hypothetical protein